MKPTEFDFMDQLAMSQGEAENASIAKILVENIPSAINATLADKKSDRQGVDWFVELISGRIVNVDCKVREKDFAAKNARCDDLALESFSVVEQSVVGWTRDTSKKTDYVLWLWVNTGRWSLVPFQMLCAVYAKNWERWRAEYKTSRQYTPRTGGAGYHSECTFVPRRAVWAEIYKEFSGQIAPVKSTPK